ncbi:MAG: NADH:flavin oxidoreductase/NADH oxidase [Haloferacaceae archaeon]
MSIELFTPLDLGGTELPNRVMVSPMCQYSCEDRDGMPTDWHRQHLKSRAVGGAGLVMTEATAVSPEGRITPQDLGIWTDDHADALADVAAFVRDQGSVPGMQLAHAGRKASAMRPWEGRTPLAPDEGGWETLSPSGPYPYEDDDPPATRRMDHTDIARVRKAFADAAERAVGAGFEVVEIHAAHGYLLHEFLSPVSNDREDEYGGDFEGRTRLVREVVDAVNARVDDAALFVRFSATDWLDDRSSWTVEDTARLADDLAGDVDLVDVSAGGLHPAQAVPSTGPGYQVRYARRVREATDGILVGAVGGITAPEQADALLRNGRADLAILGREHLRDPYFTLHAARELGVPDAVDVPIQYRRAF